MRFKLIVAGLLGVFGLYAAFWVYMANELESRLLTIAADEQAKGNELRWETLDVTGFPARMRAELTELAYVQHVKSDKMRFIMTKTLVADFLPYRTNHAILDFPETVIIDRHSSTKPGARLQTILDFDAAHMSVVVTDQGPRISFEGTAANITDDVEGAFTADHVGFHLRPGSSPRALDLYIDATQAVIPAFAPDAYDVKAKTTAQQAEVLYHGLTVRDWAEVGGILEHIDLSIQNEQFAVLGRGAATVSEAGILRAKLDVTVDQTRAFLDRMGALQDWSDKNRSLIESLVNMADLADGSPDQKANVTLVADEQAVMAGPFRIDDSVDLGPVLGF